MDICHDIPNVKKKKLKYLTHTIQKKCINSTSGIENTLKQHNTW